MGFGKASPLEFGKDDDNLDLDREYRDFERQRFEAIGRELETKRRDSWQPNLYLKKLRIRNKLSQSEFASLMGVTTRHYQNIEAGKNDASMRALQNLAKKIDLDFNMLFTGSVYAGVRLLMQSNQIAISDAIRVIDTEIEMHAGRLAADRADLHSKAFRNLKTNYLNKWKLYVLSSEAKLELAKTIIYTFGDPAKCAENGLRYNEDEQRKLIGDWLFDLWEYWSFEQLDF